MPGSDTVNTRFARPVTIRSRKRHDTEHGARLDLIDRIADLQGIDVAEQADDTAPYRVTLHLEPAERPGREMVSTWDWPKFSRTSLQ